MLPLKKKRQKDKFMKKVFILGDIGLYQDGGFHFGDEAMFLGNVNWYKNNGYKVFASSRSISHNTDLFIETLDIYIKGFVHYFFLLFCVYIQKYLRINFSPKYFKNTISNLVLCDRLHISGGGNLNEFWPGHVLYRSLMINIAYLHNIPIYISGQTIGNFHNVILRGIILNAIKKAEIIGVRDKVRSINNLLKLGVKAEKIHFCPDDILLLNNVSNSNANKKFVVGISLHKFDNIVNHEEEVFGKTILDIKARFPNVEFRLIPHYCNDNEKDDDIFFMKRIFENAGLENFRGISYKKLMPKLDIAEQLNFFLGQYSNLDLVISTRYHGALCALINYIPAISINLNDYYEQKNHTFYAELGLDTELFLFNLENLKSKKITDSIKCIISHKKLITNRIIDGIEKLKKIEYTFYSNIK